MNLRPPGHEPDELSTASQLKSGKTKIFLLCFTLPTNSNTDSATPNCTNYKHKLISTFPNFCA